MENKTTEFSFVLKPAEHGVGVFIAHGIKKGTYLRLFEDEEKTTEVSILRKKNDVPDFFAKYCINRGEVLRCPKDFGCMEIGWYLSHSNTPNAHHINYKYYALHDIKTGEEITIDYNALEEPEGAKEGYYKTTS